MQPVLLLETGSLRKVGVTQIPYPKEGNSQKETVASSRESTND